MNRSMSRPERSPLTPTVLLEEARVLKPSNSRPVMRYTISYLDRARGSPERGVVIAKVYRRGSAAIAFQSMTELWRDGFGRGGALTIPAPLARLSSPDVLLQSCASGRPLYDFLDAPSGATGYVRLAGRWLAKLHAATASGAPVLGADEESEKIGAYSRTLEEKAPAFSNRIAALGERIARLLRDLAGPRVPTHGDFQPKNIYVRRNRVTVIDFDRFALAHPARDLGHFVGQSMTMSYVRTGSFGAVRPWIRAFLEEYVRAASP